MIRYYSRSTTDKGHLYKYDDETNLFYWMDHCWTGEGQWVLGEKPTFDIVEITEDQAMRISLGTLYTAPYFER